MSNAINEKEAAKRLGVSPRTLQMWRQQGNGPAYVKMGVKVVYPIQELINWVAKNTVLTKEAA